MRPHYVNLIASFISFSQSIFGKLDVDHDGDITEDEFIQVFHSHLSFFWKSKLELGTLSQLVKADSELSVSQGCLMDEDLVRLLGD